MKESIGLKRVNLTLPRKGLGQHMVTKSTAPVDRNLVPRVSALKFFAIYGGYGGHTRQVRDVEMTSN